MKQIDTLEQWYTFSDMLSAAGYRLFPSQCEENNEEGYKVRLFASGRPDLYITTRDAEVYNAILQYKPSGFERG
ncbi:MAG: hypothetical protein GXX89_06435 [Clostridiales bacterium]|jgi:hypothetical protein|nr:hypothetical protein [Clostridiales bacterium]